MMRIQSGCRQDSRGEDPVEILPRELGADLVANRDQIDPRYFTAYNEAPGVRPHALVRPRTVKDVSRALSIYDRLGQTVVPQGGLTGLARGAVPIEGEFV
jgi:FAD/FMN-containing dehydrogenase